MGGQHLLGRLAPAAIGRQRPALGDGKVEGPEPPVAPVAGVIEGDLPLRLVAIDDQAPGREPHVAVVETRHQGSPQDPAAGPAGRI